MARRGENIRKRKDGRWEGRYIKGRKPDRTAIWGYIYGHTYTEVKRKMTIRKAEVRACALSEQNMETDKKKRLFMLVMTQRKSF